MQNNQSQFNSPTLRRQVLIVDDEPINRAILSEHLGSGYELFFAADGAEALEKIREYRETLSLVLLDLMMPVMKGQEVLKLMKEDPETQRIPVIVLTADPKEETNCLNLGAVDFIAKPYPSPEVIQARVTRTIELTEDRQIIQYTERDPLTGLYNREFFYRYAEQYDRHHKAMKMDAIVVDINHFHMINERFGTEYGDDVLRRIAQSIKEQVHDKGGMVCRRESDTFLVYCPHGENYEAILEHAAQSLAAEESESSRIRIRMGVYPRVDKSLDIVRRFDRAQLAANSVRSSFTKTVGYYDNELHEKELYAEQLVEDFQKALEEKQFCVYYQPKFNVRGEVPVLASSEALVRWKHPKLGMINPGVFIPLFEENGLIRTLDHYVWREAASQVRAWRDRYDFVVPVSVNVSRIDMYDPNLIDTFRSILKEYDVTPNELLLEITESAYTENSGQIIETVEELRRMGFRIEMDDFGSGYSSLNMVSKLPIDALKMDMQFIRSAFSQKRETWLLEIIIDIAKYLKVPVIAEGVETLEQLETLRDMGCDLVQGYYFSKPIPAKEYESFVQERCRQEKDGTVGVVPSVFDRSAIAQREAEAVSKQAGSISEETAPVREDEALAQVFRALSNNLESIYYVNMETGAYREFASSGGYGTLQLSRSGTDFFKDCATDILEVVLPEDQMHVAEAFQHDYMISMLKDKRIFFLEYHLIISGAPRLYRAQVMYTDPQDNKHVVVCVSHIENRTQEFAQQGEGAEHTTFRAVADALARENFSIYYVNLQTGHFVHFDLAKTEQGDESGENGTDFISYVRNRIMAQAHPEDKALALEQFTQENIHRDIISYGTFNMNLRMLENGVPNHTSIRAVLMDDNRHIAVGVSNINAVMKRQTEVEEALKQNLTYSSIAQALARDYFSIYYININTEEFFEYSSDAGYDELGIEKGGGDFFNLSRENVRRVLHPDDKESFLTAFTRENILEELKKYGTFTINYRLMFGDKPNHVSMKATTLDEDHIVIGVNSIEAQMQREMELSRAREKVNRDALTGVKSKHAYVEAEAEIYEQIRSGEAEPFAVVVCDVNNLKAVNDIQGHAAGDELIKVASREICSIFSHSPVFRYGGDEFIVLLKGRDYENRSALLGELSETNTEHQKTGEVIIANGMAQFDPETDRAVRDVFQKADAAMYENKKALKGGRT